MSGRIRYHPNCSSIAPEKIILITAFQNLILDNTLREDMCYQDNHIIQPQFGDTLAHRIILDPTLTAYKIRCIAFLPLRIALLTCMLRCMRCIWNLLKCIFKMGVLRWTASAKVSFPSIGSAYKIFGSKFLLIFPVCLVVGLLMYSVIKFCAMNLVTGWWCKKMLERENPVLSDLAKNNAWWEDDEGETFYLDIVDSAGMGMAINTVAVFAYKHLEVEKISLLESGKGMIHIWDKEFQQKLDQPQNLELAAKQICMECSVEVEDIIKVMHDLDQEMVQK